MEATKIAIAIIRVKLQLDSKLSPDTIFPVESYCFE